jgi:hypothetical protein
MTQSDPKRKLFGYHLLELTVEGGIDLLKNHFDKGWELYGSPIIGIDPSNPQVYQAVIKYEEVKEEIKAETYKNYACWYCKERFTDEEEAEKHSIICKQEFMDRKNKEIERAMERVIERQQTESDPWGGCSVVVCGDSSAGREFANSMLRQKRGQL